MLGAALGDPEADGDGLPAADGLAEGLGVAGAGDGDADGVVAVPVVQALKIKRQAEKMNNQIRYRFMKNPSHSPAQTRTDPGGADEPLYLCNDGRRRRLLSRDVSSGSPYCPAVGNRHP